MDTKLTMSKLKNPLRAAALLLPCVLFSSTAYAIPSPDLVINLSASVAQLLGLLSVIFGGVVFSKKGKPGKKANSRVSKASKTLLMVTLGGLILSLAVNLLQYTRGIDHKNARLHTNLVRKSVENGKAVGDTNLKTLSFSEQKTHPNGITTDTLAEWLAEGKQLNVYDVREDAEVAGGTIEGAKHIRYPDLLANPGIIPKTGNNLLLCYSGNRSSELCNLLRSTGKSCNFMVGGYEKWMTESRPLNRDGKSSNELRSLPDFANKDTLLDTPEVLELVNNEKAEFVDVRYPGDYSQGHLPNSHNITMRALSSDDLEVRLNELPDTPLVAACYDKRSCFYSQLIGLSLTEKGKDYRGRYTVPHEFYQARGAREHVQLWQAANEKVTLVTAITDPLTKLLQWFKDKSGHYILGIVLLVLVVRLTLLPLTLKSERDQAVQKSLVPTLDGYKTDYASHPRALSKATMELYRKHKIKPVFNIIASLAQLGLLLLFYSVVNNAAGSWQQTFAWLDLPSLADPLYIMPLLVTGSFMYIMFMQLTIKSRKAKILFALGGAAFFALVHALSAAVNIYLAFSMMVLIGQNFLVRYLTRRYNWDGKNAPPAQELPDDDGIIPLSRAHLLESTGKKAARLGELIEAGYNVPDGFVFTDHITAANQNGQQTETAASISMTQAQLSKLHQLWKQLDAQHVAVRSSGVSEDGGDTSFAGVYDSILNVKKKELLGAVRKVHLSLSSDRASSYNSGVNATSTSEAEIAEYGGVVVQKMVDAEYAGVMFTEHPVNAGATLVEVVAGLGEELVSGTVTPDSYSFGKFSGQALSNKTCEIDLQPLLALGKELEQLFNHPQDIEWAYSDGEFYLLQARDITRSVCDSDSLIGTAEKERRRLLNLVKLADDDLEHCLVQNELSELLPNPTAASISFMQMLWSAGGSTDIACQQLGIPYDVSFKSNKFVTTVFGKTYVNKVEEQYRLKKGPGALSAFQLARNADAMEQQFRDEIMPHLVESAAINKAIDYTRLPLPDMIATLHNKLENFVTDTYVEAELINIAADYYWKTATAKLTAAGIEPAKYLNYAPQTVVSEAMAMITQPDAGKPEIETFLALSGHRASYDYELSMPRYEEDPSLLINIMKGPGHTSAGHKTAPLPEKKLLRISVDRVHRFQALKEEAKHYCLISLYEIRRLLLAIDQSCELDGTIFQLTIDEILQLSDELDSTDARKLIAQRLQEQEYWRSINPPTQLTLRDLELMDMASGQVKRDRSESDMVGKRVAGEGNVTGVARVINSVDDIDEFEKGEILVARMTDPQWYPLFPLAKGIVTEIGGWLSHAAIVAREYNLPAIVGVNDACNSICTGDVVELTADGTVVMVEERRKPDSAMRDVPQQDPDVADVLTAAAPTRVILNGRSGVNGTRSVYDKRDRTAKQVLRNYVRALNTNTEPLRKAQ